MKDFVQRQFVKILQGKVSIQDYIFAKEYRGVKGYKPGATVPALELARYVCVAFGLGLQLNIRNILLIM